LYSRARNEASTASITENGEAVVQANVLAAVPLETPLQVVDIGANQGDWTRSLLRQAVPERRTSTRLRIDAFAPLPATADRFDQELLRLLERRPSACTAPQSRTQPERGALP
jgi:hypothetical protein